MCLHSLCRFFKINTLINLVFLVLTAVIYYAFGDHIYQLHSHVFAISKEEFDALYYALMGIYKLFFWVFNFVPMVALCCLCRCPKTMEHSCGDQKKCA